MAKFGEYAKTGYSGEFEMMEEGWHKVKATAAEILDQKKWQSELTEKKLKLTFETTEEVNSDGYPFKMFHWIRVEVDPTSDKSKLNQLIVGLYGSVPEDIMDRDIEEDLIGKRAEVLTVNKPNKDGSKTFTEIIKFRQITGKTTAKKPEKNNVDQMFANLSEEERKKILSLIAGQKPAEEPKMSRKEVEEAEKEAATPMKPEDDIKVEDASIDFESVPF
jgi:hypothetical protein